MCPASDPATRSALWSQLGATSAASLDGPVFHLESACLTSTMSRALGPSLLHLLHARALSSAASLQAAAATLQACIKLRNFRQLDCTAKRPRRVAAIFSRASSQRDCTTRRRPVGVGEASNASVGAESFGHRLRSPYASQPFGGSLFGSPRQRTPLSHLFNVTLFIFLEHGC